MSMSGASNSNQPIFRYSRYIRDKLVPFCSRQGKGQLGTCSYGKELKCKFCINFLIF